MNAVGNYPKLLFKLTVGIIKWRFFSRKNILPFKIRAVYEMNCIRSGKVIPCVNEYIVLYPEFFIES
ncbi:hypothetical protein CQ012_00555 [Arthrobacter sp. MYb214]|nr:hypothetical protein CQ012_00555 [Arthrobacter sp. MYb214]